MWVIWENDDVSGLQVFGPFENRKETMKNIKEYLKRAFRHGGGTVEQYREALAEVQKDPKAESWIFKWGDRDLECYFGAMKIIDLAKYNKE